MKQELPIAVSLLAAGCLLWFCQSTPSLSPVPGVRNGHLALQIKAENTSNGRRVEESDSNPDSFAVVQQASFQADVEPVRPSDTTASLYLHPTPNDQAVQFLASVSQQLANSKPLQSSLQLTGNLFGQSFSGNGNYYQMGQGTHKSRIQLTFGNEANSPSISQLCDGRFVYSLQSNGNIDSFEFVDLKRIQQIDLAAPSQFSPTGWVATGGIASLFQHLASAFNFGEPLTLENSDIILKGSWDSKAIRQIVDSNETESDGSSSIQWDQIPVQLPHAVEIVFSKDSQFNYFPKQITFFKFVDRDEPTQVVPTVSLVFQAPRPLHHATDRFFVVDSSNLESIDVTDQYIARIQKTQRKIDSNIRNY